MVDFSSLLPKTKSKTNSFFWSIVIEPSWIHAGIWNISQGETRINSVGNAVHWEKDEDLVSIVDTALSSAVQNLEDDIDDPSNAVFGIPSEWVSEGQIKPQYLENIKKVCQELSLDPKGFVVLPEAIANFIKTEESVPFTGVILGLRENNLEVSLFRNGNLAGTENVSRSVSIVDDVVEGLTRLYSGEAIPSRFVIYNSKESELEDALQEIVKHDWSSPEKISFLHTPKVETFLPKQKVYAVTLAGGTEIANATSVDTGKSEEDTKEMPDEKQTPETETGFVVGKDISDSEEEAVENREFFSDNIASVQEMEGELEDQSFEIEEPKKPKRKISAISLLSSMKEKLTAIKPGKPKGPAGPGGRILVIGIILFTLLVGVGVSIWYFLPKASVTVYIAPKKLEERITVYIDPSAQELDISKSVLPGNVLTTTASGDRTKSTTGKKTVGEKAKGTVEVRNGTSSGVRLPAGTIIRSDNDLAFETVSSASVSAAMSPTKPGTETVDVVASDIGSEYNLESETEFKVSNFPSAEVDAVSTNDFSGGESKEVAAVAESDMEALTKELEEELVQKAVAELEGDVEQGEELLKDSVFQTVTDRKFSNNAGEEASSLKLDMLLEVAGVSVKRDQLIQLTRDVLDTKIPEGFVLKDDQVEIDFKYEEDNEGIYQMQAFIVANLLPEINPDEITDRIAGKYPHIAREYLNSIPGFVRAEIILNPRLPGRMGNLPYQRKNISVEVAAER